MTDKERIEHLERTIRELADDNRRLAAENAVYRLMLRMQETKLRQAGISIMDVEELFNGKSSELAVV